MCGLQSSPSYAIGSPDVPKLDTSMTPPKLGIHVVYIMEMAVSDKKRFSAMKAE